MRSLIFLQLLLLPYAGYAINQPNFLLRQFTVPNAAYMEQVKNFLERVGSSPDEEISRHQPSVKNYFVALQRFIKRAYQIGIYNQDVITAMHLLNLYRARL